MQDEALVGVAEVLLVAPGGDAMLVVAGVNLALLLCGSGAGNMPQRFLQEELEYHLG
jgi:hypothetical protein